MYDVSLGYTKLYLLCLLPPISTQRENF